MVTFQEMFDTLIHEWAHCTGWTHAHSSFTDHDANWGVHMSAAYRAAVED